MWDLLNQKQKCAPIQHSLLPGWKEWVSLSGFIQWFFCLTKNSFNYRCSAAGLSSPSRRPLSSADDLIVLTASCAGDACTMKPRIPHFNNAVKFVRSCAGRTVCFLRFYIWNVTLFHLRHLGCFYVMGLITLSSSPKSKAVIFKDISTEKRRNFKILLCLLGSELIMSVWFCGFSIR